MITNACIQFIQLRPFIQHHPKTVRTTNQGAQTGSSAVQVKSTAATGGFVDLTSAHRELDRIPHPVMASPCIQKNLNTLPVPPPILQAVLLQCSNIKRPRSTPPLIILRILPPTPHRSRSLTPEHTLRAVPTVLSPTAHTEQRGKLARLTQRVIACARVALSIHAMPGLTADTAAKWGSNRTRTWPLLGRGRLHGRRLARAMDRVGMMMQVTVMVHIRRTAPLTPALLRTLD